MQTPEVGYNRYGMVWVSCPVCGGRLRTSPGRPRTYCSRKCRWVVDREPLEVRFWKHVEKTESCWLWTGATDGRGYGKIGSGSHQASPLTASRASYALAYGPIPDGLWVLHRCDTPACVRPDHLFLGNNDDNVRDKMAKGRHLYKLSTERRAELLADWTTGNFSKMALARKYRISDARVRQLVT